MKEAIDKLAIISLISYIPINPPRNNLQDKIKKGSLIYIKDNGYKCKKTIQKSWRVTK